jgi:hypothetical protein
MPNTLYNLIQPQSLCKTRIFYILYKGREDCSEKLTKFVNNTQSAKMTGLQISLITPKQV